jgi:two-component system cell cycle response regulator DivK
MSVPFDPDALAHLRDAARRLAQRARDHETQLESFVDSCAADARRAEAALSYPSGVTRDCVDHLLMALHAQAQRSVECVRLARQLCVTARAQQVAADGLASDLAGVHTADDRWPAPPEGRPAVLVVDDYEDTRELVSIVLREAGFIVRTASNGLEALIAAYEMRPAVIVMDVTMPVLDGVEATRLIKATAATRHARVIAHTAKPPMSEKMALWLFAAVLEKPSPPDVVLATVRQYATA